MFIKKIIKKQTILSVATLLVLSIIVVGSSYGLFQEVYTDDNTQALNVGDLVVAFSNNSGNELTNTDAIDLDLEPMTDEQGIDPLTNNLYAFSINNTGSIAYCYTVKLIDNPSYLAGGANYSASRKLLSHDYLRYKLNDESVKVLGDQTNDIIASYTINPEETLNYTLKIWVADAETYHLPNSVIGSEVHLNIIIDGEACEERKPYLRTAILADNEVATPLTVPGQAISSSEEALLASTTDDYGTSYYFRGAVENNYVVFAGMCWRVVRIDGLGNIKLVLYNYRTSSSNPCSESGTSYAFARYSGTTYDSAFNSNYNSNAYEGFMYGATATSATYANAHANINKSTILTNLETWYVNNLGSSATKDYTDYLADVIWCNDKSTTDSGTGTGTSYYGSRNRLNTVSSASPSLICPPDKEGGKLSKFTVSDTTNGNGALTYKTGLLTADEIAFAGGIYNLANTTYYLYNNSTSSAWWSLSPRGFDSNTYVWRVDTSGYLYGSRVDNQGGLRPAVSLISNITIDETKNSDGTSSKPYYVVTT